MRNLKFALVSLLVLAVGAVAASTTGAEDDLPRAFSSAEDLAAAVVEAAGKHDVDALVALVGPQHTQLFRTGDDAADRRARSRFAEAAAERVRVHEGKAGRATLYAGYADWAFPVPLVKEDRGWVLDGSAGILAARDRRVGTNEIAAITFCEAVFTAQHLYHGRDWDRDGVLEYAGRLVSTPGMQDGLYWEAKAGEPVSPLGRVLGISGRNALGQGPGAAWMGYEFRLLPAQGRCAPGGAHAYRINGNLVAGFALLATPKSHGETGIATFLMGPNGAVMQRDFAAKTSTCTRIVRQFEPSPDWMYVN